MAIGVFSTTAAGTGNSGETLVTEALKEHYKPQRIKEMVYKNNPLLALMPKYESFGGENMPIPIIVSGPQRRSAVFSNGQDNSNASSVQQFLLTRVRDYSFASITHEAIRASAGNADAFVRYATMEVDGAVHALKRSMAVAMYRDGTGAIGTVGSVASQVFTLTNPEDTANFEVGMILTCFDGLTDTATDSRFGKPDSTDQESGDVTVSSVDRSAGTITVTGTVTNMDAGDVFVQKGDLNAKISGLEAWCPRVVDSNNAALFGVTRTTDVSRLGGNRYDGSALPIEEALIEGLSLAARNGGTPSHVMMHYKNYSQLEKALGSKVQYDKVSSSDASVGFSSMKIHGPAGTVDVIPDVNCQPDVAWGLQLDTWSLNSLGAAPQILDLDGSNMLRESTADAYEVRCGFYGNVACSAPGWNVRIAL